MSTLNKVALIKSENISAVPVSASELPLAKTVLVVEDDLCCLMSLRLMLELYGCRVLSANACVEALALLRKNQEAIDLILLDIMMPDKSGIDFMIEARTENILAGIPVVIQSFEGDEIIQKALDKGACDYIQKPYIKEEISRVVTNLTKRTISGSALQAVGSRAFGFSSFGG